MRTIMILTALVVMLAASMLPASASRSDYVWLDEPAPVREQVCDCSKSTSNEKKACPDSTEETPESEYTHNF